MSWVFVLWPWKPSKILFFPVAKSFGWRQFGGVGESNACNHWRQSQCRDIEMRFCNISALYGAKLQEVDVLLHSLGFIRLPPIQIENWWDQLKSAVSLQVQILQVAEMLLFSLSGFVYILFYCLYTFNVIMWCNWSFLTQLSDKSFDLSGTNLVK